MSKKAVQAWAGHIPLRGTPLSDEGAPAGQGDTWAKAAVSLPMPGFQSPRGADGSGTVIVQVRDPMCCRRWDSQPLPTRVYRLLGHRIERSSDVPAGEIKGGVGETGMFPAAQVATSAESLPRHLRKPC